MRRYVSSIATVADLRTTIRVITDKKTIESEEKLKGHLMQLSSRILFENVLLDVV